MKKFENQRIAGFGYLKNLKEPRIFILKEPIIFIIVFMEELTMNKLFSGKFFELFIFLRTMIIYQNWFSEF